MSLLNDALKDLDRAAQNAEGKGSQYVAGTVKERNVHLKRFWLPVVAALVVLLWLIIEMNILGLMPEKENITPDQIAPIALNSKWLTVAAGTENTKLHQPIGVAPVTVSRVSVAGEERVEANPREQAADKVIDSSGAAPLDELTGIDGGSSIQKQRLSRDVSANSEAVTELLARAKQALAEDRLMTPAGDNAYQLFSSVLLLEPKSAAAHAGIADVQQRYLQLVELALQNRGLSKAELYLDRALKAGALAQQVEPYRQQIELRRNEPEQKNKKRITFDKDQDVAQRLRGNPLAQYENKAWSLISGSEPSLKTTMALADAYAAVRNGSQLRRLVSKAKPSEPAAGAYVQAQWLILNGDLDGAVAVLTPYADAVSEDVVPVRLLAGVYAGLNDYDNALPLYRQLVDRPEFNLNDWLGYAIALERAGERQTALHAYQRISRIRHADRRINDYIHGRIRDLSGEY